MGFHQVNNDATSTLASAYTTGGTTLTVASGHGSRFGTPTSDNPIYVTCITDATVHTDSEVRTHFEATGRTGDQLTGVSVVSGSTDRNFAIGDAIEMRMLDAHLEEIHTAVGLNALDSAVVHDTGNETIAGTKTFSTVPVLGSLTGILKASSGTVTAATGGTDYANASHTHAQGDVTGLAAALAALATDSLVVHLAGAETITGDKTFSGTIAGFKGVINLQTGTSYTLQASDSGKVVICSNASAITLTLPNSLAAGFNCLVIQGGAGAITFTAGAGATLNQRESLSVSAGQHAQASLVVTSNAGSAAVYNLGGDLA